MKKKGFRVTEDDFIKAVTEVMFDDKDTLDLIVDIPPTMGLLTLFSSKLWFQLKEDSENDRDS